MFYITGYNWGYSSSDMMSVVGGRSKIHENILVKTVMEELYGSLDIKTGSKLELQGRDSTI